mmetsp:Transcript_15649/g.38974  ORF Transcript_15649/g.38974 Transcript_15649/m.38974 type:complete len:380 (+) Transcript_15649:47-1186(+)
MCLQDSRCIHLPMSPCPHLCMTPRSGTGNLVAQQLLLPEPTSHVCCICCCVPLHKPPARCVAGLTCLARRSVGLDRGKDGAHKHPRCQPAHCPHGQVQAGDEDGHVGQVDERRHGARQRVQRRHQEADRVQRHVQGDRATALEGAPPPAVVLGAQLHVRAQHADLRVDGHGEQADEQHKAKQVVEVAQPQRGHGKVELNEQRAKGQHAGSKEQQGGVGGQGGRGDMAGDLVGLDGVLADGHAQRQVAAHKRERDGHQEPHRHDGEVHGHRHGARGARAMDGDVDEREDGHDHARVEGGGARDHTRPPRVRALHHAPHVHRHKARHHRQPHVQHDGGGEQRAARRGRQEAQGGQAHGDQRGADDLNARPDVHGQGARGGR